MSRKCVSNIFCVLTISILLIVLSTLGVLTILNCDKVDKINCLIDGKSVGICINYSLCYSVVENFTESDCSSGNNHICCPPDRIIDESEKDFAQHENFLFINSAHFGSSGELNHVVDLGFQNGTDRVSFLCSGSVISHHFIITSARCVLPANSNVKL